jgi:hypothetical protein
LVKTTAAEMNPSLYHYVFAMHNSSHINAARSFPL